MPDTSLAPRDPCLYPDSDRVARAVSCAEHAFQVSLVAHCVSFFVMSLILLFPSCTAGNKPPILTVWLYYVSAMFYDLLTLGISTYYLIGFGPNFGK